MKRLITLYVVSFGVAVTSFSLALAGLLQPKCSQTRLLHRKAGALLAARDDIIIRSEPKNLARSLSGDFVCLILFPVYRIHFATPHSSPLELSTNFGLFQRCDSSQWTGARVTCRRFPTRHQDCQAPGLSAVDKATLHSLFHDPASTPESTSGLSIRPSALELQALLGAVPADTNDAWGFCDSWISAGYFQQLSLVLGFAAVIACFAAIVTPLHSRRKPYRLISSLLFGHAVALIASTSLVAHEFNTSDRFVYGSRLAQSFVMSTTAWSMDVVVVATLVLVIGFLKVGDEGGYERIQD